jgi:CO/xanthine dehydrogenase Mo-binding subunit
MMANYSVVGQSVYRTDANPKVTGRALHVGNIEMPGMLHVAVLRSPYAHARITRIEKSKAEALEGVAVVLTGAEIAKMPGLIRISARRFAISQFSPSKGFATLAIP